ncbi:MAG: hypothetical protein V4638_02785 [Bacteroidota bacterium]
MKTIIVLLVLFNGLASFAQIRTFIEADYTSKIDSMRKEWGQNKSNISPKYELPILIALSYYPELKNAHIDFKEQKIKTSMNAQPTLGSILFRKKDNWHFTVRINNQEKDSMVHVSQVPFNALVGVFGHEFYHFMDYKTKKPGHFLGFLFKYMSKKGKKKVEYYTDLGTIKRGLGWQCYDFEHYVQHVSKATVAYKKFKAETYLSAEQILEEMKKLEMYGIIP